MLLILSGSIHSTMDIDVISEDENPMLHRTDVRFEITHDEATPSRLSVRDSLAAMLNKDADEVVVRDLDTKFGMRKTVGTARVYESPDFARDVEQEYMLDRNKIAPDPDAETGEEA
jgi:small subunit ribosomal protein S24e